MPHLSIFDTTYMTLPHLSWLQLHSFHTHFKIIPDNAMHLLDQ